VFLVSGQTPIGFYKLWKLNYRNQSSKYTIFVLRNHATYDEIMQLLTQSITKFLRKHATFFCHDATSFATTQRFTQYFMIFLTQSLVLCNKRKSWKHQTHPNPTPPPPTNPPPTYTCTTTGPSPPPITSQPLTPHYHHSPTPPLTKIYSNFYCPLDLDNINTSLVL
jgi:hypothetical protein